MYIGGPLFLIVLGAMLRWAVTVESAEFNIQLAGLILFIVGIIGLVVALIFWFSRRSPVVPPPADHVIHERVVHDEVPPEHVKRDDVHEDHVQTAGATTSLP